MFVCLPNYYYICNAFKRYVHAMIFTLPATLFRDEIDGLCETICKITGIKKPLQAYSGQKRQTNKPKNLNCFLYKRIRKQVIHM